MSFNFAKVLYISGSPDGTQTNYQMKLIINRGAGTDSAGTIYLNNNSLNWPYDIKFTNADGVVLDYWRESYDTAQQIVWIEVDKIFTVGETIHVNYGKADETDKSNGDNTFPFFDHFEGSSLNTSKWNTYGLNSVSNSEVTVDGNTYTYDNSRIWAKTGFGYNYAIRVKWKRTLWKWWSALGIGFNGNWGISREVTQYANVYGYGYDNNYSPYLRFITNNGVSTTTTTLYSNMQTDVYYTTDIIRNGTINAIALLNDDNKTTHTTNLPTINCEPDIYARGGIDRANDKETRVVVDWIFVRKCTDNEPVWTLIPITVKRIENLRSSIYEDVVKIDWDYSDGKDFEKIELFWSSPFPDNWNFIKNIFPQDITMYIDEIHYGSMFPYETVYHKFILYDENLNILQNIGTEIVYPPPQPIINLQLSQFREGIKLTWEHGEGAKAFVDEIYTEKEGNLILLGTQDSSIEFFIDTIPKDENKTYTYYLRSRGEITFWSPFVSGTAEYIDPLPQIEFGVNGEALRHAIYTFHNDDESSRNSLIFKLWNKTSKDLLEEPKPDNPDIILNGDKKVFAKNIFPMIHEFFDLGKDTDIWRKTYSINTYSDKSNSAKLKLWNGK